MQTKIISGLTLIMTGLILSGLSDARAQARKLEGELTASLIRGNIHLFQMGSAGNVAVSVGEDGVALIDDQFAPMSKRINAAIDQLTDQPVRYVFNTHWH